jgi:hypothetical protein
MALLVDSLLAMSAEHLRRGDLDAALAAGSTRRGTWKHRGENADLHLFDSSSLIDLMRRAGMRRVHAHGLLVSAGVLGVPALTDALERSPESARVAERRLSSVPALADLGKQLLVIGNRP